MGLSDEERVSKFFWSMQGWRSRLATFADQLDPHLYVDRNGRGRSQEVARSWTAKVDSLVGQLIQTAGQSGGYWLFGEADLCLRGVLIQPYELRRYAEPDSYVSNIPHEPGSLAWWQDDATMENAARYLQGKGLSKHEGLSNLGRWWDLYGYFSAVIYPVWRYANGPFSAQLKAELLQLVGEMVNRRFDVCFGYAEAHEGVDVAKMELFLLLKQKTFDTLLRKAKGSLVGDAYSKASYDGEALWNRVARMSAKEMYDCLEQEANDARAKIRGFEAAKAKEDAKRDSVPVDGLFGPPVPRLYGDAGESIRAPRKSKKRRAESSLSRRHKAVGVRLAKETAAMRKEDERLFGAKRRAARS